MAQDFASRNPTILVIFGATGDLASRKLIPALFHLWQKQLLPSFIQIIAFSRRPLTDEQFRAHVVRCLYTQAKTEAALKFSKLFFYQQGYFDKQAGYTTLSTRLGMTDNTWRACSNKLFYLAVPPTFYKTILKNLSSSGLTKPCSPEEGWTRILIEKPFGKDEKTAQELDKLLGALFKEEQIYRIDHYLGKETVQNILAFRFSNSIFEPSWDREHIESIHIELLEVAGVGKRGDFYDSVGALRDVGQNHMLQLLALFTMDNPGVFDGPHIRAGRYKVLKNLIVPPKSEMAHLAVRGQYKEYRRERGVKRTSKTETYFRIQTGIATPRWEGVPIFLEAGKGLGEDSVKVTVRFRHQTPCLCSGGQHFQNVLHYRIQPEEGIRASFWVKKPGVAMELEEKDFSFNYHSAYKKNLSDPHIAPYEKLLLEAVQGNQTLFVSTSEIMASWKFIDPITRSWHSNSSPLQLYPKHSAIMRTTSLQADTASQEIGLVGLGKMGSGIACRLQEKGWRVHVFDKNREVLKLFPQETIKHESIEKLIQALHRARTLWLMVPAFAKATTRKPSMKPVDEILFGKNGLAKLMSRGDVIIDGGNSFYKDTLSRAKKLKLKGIHYLDVGVSGGPSGARSGASLMVGGDKKLFKRLEPLFQSLSVARGYEYVGPSGSGHFVKMIHNGIEYGMMQAIAEGFAIMQKSPYKLDLSRVAKVYNRGSVVQSRLVGWLEKAFVQSGTTLKDISGSVAHTGEGEWTVKIAKQLGVATPVMKASFDFRVASAKKPSYTGQILSALRNQFGGHEAKAKNPKN